MGTVVYSLSDETLENIISEAHEEWSDMRRLNLMCDAVICTEDGGSFNVHR